jgi:hypothetical protein
MNFFEPDFVVPFLLFMIPIIAIIGAFTTGIVRMIGRQRLVELAQQERIAAIQRGIDPAQLAPLHADLLNESSPFPPGEHARRQHRSLVVGGVVTLFAGIGIALFFYFMRPDHQEFAWAVGLIPIMLGIGLLVAAALVRPRDIPHA